MKHLPFLFALLFASSGFAAVSPSFTVTANADGTLRTLPNGVAVQSASIATGVANAFSYYPSTAKALSPVPNMFYSGSGPTISASQSVALQLALQNLDGQEWDLRSLGSSSGFSGQFGLFNATAGYAFTVNLAGKTTFKAPTTSNASINLPHGTAPTSPVNGDVWTTTAGLYAYVNGSVVGPFSTGGGTAGNPTASVGLSAVNGVASSFMRSDAAPALSQSIVPTWAGLHTFSAGFVTTFLRSTGVPITDANAMAALAIDVTKYLNTKTIAADSSLTFSATPAVSNTWFMLRLTNSDTNPHVITIPSTFDSNSQQTITTFNILAGGVETIKWCYDGTNYIAYGVPTSGSSAEVTVASATTTAIGAASSINVAISGTTTITSFGTIAAGVYRQGRFTGALTLTYNATSMILPSGATITTAAGDTFTAYSLGSGNWLVTDYQRATGKLLVPVSLTTDVSGILAGTNGGSGVNNSTRTMTYAGNVAFTGAFNVSFTVPGAFTYVLPAAADTLVGRTSTDTLTNKRVTARTNTTASSATPAINTDTTDEFTITALAVNITSMTTSLTGTPVNGDQLLIRFKDNGTARTIAWGTSFQSIGGTLPTTTVLSKLLYVLLIWNSTDSKWDCVSTSQQP